uniref:Cytokinin-O-glucosyltransferase 1 n=1 Tax=Aegilops tauschii TaxID=37682 RepID=N1QW28_AEGTA
MEPYVCGKLLTHHQKGSKICRRRIRAFLRHCRWNSVLETIAVGVLVLTWLIVFDQFITERLLTQVLGVGERLWQGVWSTRYDESKVVPAKAVARALTTFMEPEGPGHAARSRVMGLTVKVHAAMAEGGSSDHDLHGLIHDLREARGTLIHTSVLCTCACARFASGGST